MYIINIFIAYAISQLYRLWTASQFTLLLVAINKFDDDINRQ